MLELALNIATKILRRLNRVSSRDGNIFASDLVRKSASVFLWCRLFQTHRILIPQQWRPTRGKTPTDSSSCSIIRGSFVEGSQTKRAWTVCSWLFYVVFFPSSNIFPASTFCFPFRIYLFTLWYNSVIPPFPPDSSAPCWRHLILLLISPSPPFLPHSFYLSGFTCAPSKEGESGLKHVGPRENEQKYDRGKEKTKGESARLCSSFKFQFLFSVHRTCVFSSWHYFPREMKNKWSKPFSIFVLSN